MIFPLDLFMIRWASCWCWLIFNNEVANKSKSTANLKMWQQKYLDTISRLRIKMEAITTLAK